MSTEEQIKVTKQDDLLLLGVLSALEENASLTQRSLAKELGVALGLVHAYLKRCVKKGYVKITHVPSNRYSYYLTPHGFAEKSRLTGEYLTQSFRFFRLAKTQMSALMDVCEQNGWRRLALAGGGDLAEIAVLCAATRSVELVALIDDMGAQAELGLPVMNGTAALAASIDAVLVTSVTAGQATVESLRHFFPPERVLAPRLLKLPSGPWQVP